MIIPMDTSKIDAIWQKALSINGLDNSLIRADVCGAIIMRQFYGDRNSDFGWEIDHILPVAKGGDEQLINLRPMHWKNVIAKGDDYPYYFTAMRADGKINKPYERQIRVNDKLQKRLEEVYGK